jgi:fatty-acyl-CoA synthase
VSTNEVAEALSVFPGIQEANVYGVEVPGKVCALAPWSMRMTRADARSGGAAQDGRAGMAAVVMAPKTDLAALGQHVARALPPYAVPVFLRALPQYAAPRSPQAPIHPC